jgi:asparagine synthase (glutamine-hydrolysing)
MCGFCGVVTAEFEKKIARTTIEKMLAPLARRGPDSQGIYCKSGCALGHRRLKVIDLDGGEQPMVSSDGRFILVFNGEIYNFLDLRRQLERLGHRFTGSSDTEVLLHSCQEWGMDCLKRLVGMFVFALWDHRERKLWLVRDRLGVKPLYYAQTSCGDLVFGSEASVCLVWPEINPEIDQEAAFKYFTFGYIPGENSIFHGVRKLPPGTFMEWHGGRMSSPKVYWNLLDCWAKPQSTREDVSAILEEFSHKFKTAVKDRLISDVPLGAFLSGGLDSASVVGEMCQKQSSVSTFTIGFTENSFDEAPEARLTARHFNCDHHEEYKSMSSPELLLKVAEQLDEPLADTSILPTYVLCQEARRYFTVALSGDGGDELLAGYATHQANKHYQTFKKIPKGLALTLARMAQWLPDNERKVNFFFKLKQFTSAYPRGPGEAHAWWRSFLHPDRLRQLSEGCNPDVFEPFRKVWQEAAVLSPLDQALYVDYRTWLLDDILVKVDRASMNHGLEVRSPFLDHRLVEFCAALPSRLKRVGSSGKILLRRYAAAHGLDFVARRKKSGFGAPVASWLRGSWRELAQSAFNEQGRGAIPFVSQEALRRTWNEHVERRRDHGYFLFAALMFILWRQDINKHRCST